MATCTVCQVKANRGDISQDEVKQALENAQQLRVCEDHAGELIAICLGEMEPKDPPDLLERVLADPENATTEELMQGFVLTSAKARPDLDAEDLDW